MLHPDAIGRPDPCVSSKKKRSNPTQWALYGERLHRIWTGPHDLVRFVRLVRTFLQEQKMPENAADFGMPDDRMTGAP
jgi:hypothetical protein